VLPSIAELPDFLGPRFFAKNEEQCGTQPNERRFTRS
jgi:hypothetical protein